MWLKFESSSWHRISQLALVMICLSFMGRGLWASLYQVERIDAQVDVFSVLIGFLFTCLSFWMGTFAWAEIIRSLYPQVPYLSAIKYQLLSTAIKYLPGIGWQQISKAIQLSRSGTLHAKSLLPVTLELVFVILTGIAIAAQILYFSSFSILGLSIAPVFKLGITVIMWVTCAILPILVLKAMNQDLSTRATRKKFLFHLWLAEVLDIVGWVALGTGLWFIIRALAPLSVDALPYSIITYFVSFVAGLVVIIVPNGWGIRELTMSTLLQAILPAHLSVTVALISRVILIVAEALSVFAVGLIKFEST